LSRILFPHHRLTCQLNLGPLVISANIDLFAPWTILFGPSGSGKSTLLRAACGLLHEGTTTFLRRATPPPDIDTNELPQKSGTLWNRLDILPPHLRNLAYAPQGAALFPHLTVQQNIAFPQTVRHQPPGIAPLLDLFRLTPLAHRHPRDLSGGERQRVALARAFAVPNPTLMLLDEPFTGIDRATRDQLLPAMQQHLAARSIPVLSVTHDVEEALLLNSSIIRLSAGHITDHGPARDVLAPERASILQTLT
jgi:ABC-type sulfate/molybdate transport systems ATPase subunit